MHFNSILVTMTLESQQKKEPRQKCFFFFGLACVCTPLPPSRVPVTVGPARRTGGPPNRRLGAGRRTGPANHHRRAYRGNHLPAILIKDLY